MATIKAFKNEILRIAEANLGEKAWSYFQSRQAKRNPNVKFGTFELKNNLFVYEILLASLIDIGTPNIISDERLKIKSEGKTERPPTAQQWNEGEVPNFEEVDRAMSIRYVMRQGEKKQKEVMFVLMILIVELLIATIKQ